MFSPPRLRGHRERLGMTQQELADTMLLGVEVVINWELGVVEPSGRFQAIVASRLDMLPYEQLEPAEGLTDVQQYVDALNWAPPVEEPPVEEPAS